MGDDETRDEGTVSNANRRPTDSGQSPSRRRFLRTGLGSGAAALGLGGSGLATAATVERKACRSGGTVPVGGGTGLLINNDWSVSVGKSNVSMCVYRYADGSFGWEWDRGSTDACAECPNYPEVLIGTKPWSEHTDQSLFPVQRGDVEDLDLEIEVEMDVSDGEWNLALEWWLTPNRPPSGGPTHETMVVLDKSPAHSKGGSIEEGAVTDAYGNTLDYWANPDHVDWDFHIFKVVDDGVPSNLDVSSVMTYLDREVDATLPSSHWMTGVEVGNEYWDDTHGKTTVTDLDVRLNGQTATTGVDDRFTVEPTDATAPTAPSNLTVTSATESSLTVDWPAASDAGGSGLDHYVVSAGNQQTTVPAGTTQVTMTGMAADTSYRVSAVAVDGAGNRSAAATVTATTAGGGSDVEAIDGVMPGDVDGDGEYEDLNGNGRIDSNDVVSYFEHRDDAVVTDHVAAYDYNDNGRIDYNDLVALFQERI